MISPDIAVIIRAAGERTESLCRRLVLAQVPAESVTMVSERPFARALQRGIEIAIEKRSKWTMFLDADILLGGSAVHSMVSEMEAAHVDFYMMNFQLMDKGFCGPAYGVHCYNSRHLSRALRFMEVAWSDQRPETRLYKEMAALGYPTLLSRAIVGVHDYEQYYRDLYRKMFVRALKYDGQTSFMLETFRRRYSTSEEFKVMMWGLVDGVFHGKEGHEKALLDVEYYRARSSEVLAMLNLQEKPPSDDTMQLSPDEVIERMDLDDHYLANQHWIAPSQGVAAGGPRKPLWRRVQSRLRSVLQ